MEPFKYLSAKERIDLFNNVEYATYLIKSGIFGLIAKLHGPEAYRFTKINESILLIKTGLVRFMQTTLIIDKIVNEKSFPVVVNEAETNIYALIAEIFRIIKKTKQLSGRKSVIDDMIFFETIEFLKTIQVLDTNLLVWFKNNRNDIPALIQNVNRLSRMISRIYTLGDWGDDAKVFYEYIKNFLKINDNELGGQNATESTSAGQEGS
jgi:hypothetical protein